MARLVGQACTHNSATTTSIDLNVDVATTKAKPQQLRAYNRAQNGKAALNKATETQETKT